MRDDNSDIQISSGQLVCSFDFDNTLSKPLLEDQFAKLNPIVTISEIIVSLTRICLGFLVLYNGKVLHSSVNVNLCILFTWSMSS